jgi:drug/metabolite transporter (DMT)-like permease
VDPQRHLRLTGALLVALAAIAFSGKGVVIKLAYRYGVDAVTLLTLRMLFSAPFFLLLAWWSTRREATPFAPADIRATILLGLLGYYLASYFSFLALQHITAGLERLLLFLHPTFVVLISAAFFRRRITRRDVVAIVLSYIGIFIVFRNELATQPGNVELGTLWMILSAVLFALYLIGSGRLVGRVGSVRFASVAGLVSSVAVVIQYLATRNYTLILSQPAEVYWLSLVMALVSTVLPIVLTSVGIRRIGASHASIIGSVGPIATLFLAALFLGEHITAVQLVGAGFVLAGVLAISFQKTKAPAA